MNKKIGVIIQARTGSTRLPNKVLLPLGNKTVLENVVERIKYCNLVDEIIVATTDSAKDNPIVELCTSNRIDCYRGSESNVLSRYYEAAKAYNLDIIVRVTSDCPLIDPKVIDELLVNLMDDQADYVTNSMPPSFARGLECSAFTFNALREAYLNATTDYHKEHVVIYIRENHEKFKIKNVKNSRDDTKYRITLDELDDYKLLKIIYDDLYKENEIISVEQALTYIVKHDLIGVNAHVEQKS